MAHFSEATSSPGGYAVIGEARERELMRLVLQEVLPAVASFSCLPEEVPTCVDHLKSCGYAGVAVANPLKADAAKLATDFFRVRHGLGVANALKIEANTYAQNTEVPAFEKFVKEFESGTALVLGSGRAARSAVQVLCEKEWKVRVWNRNVARTKPLIAFFEYYGRVEALSQADPTGCSLIVNATPLGAKAGEQPPVVWTRAVAKTTCIDFVYRNVATEFLRSASARGLSTVDGRELLVEQLALAAEWWMGTTEQRERMRLASGLRSH